MVNGYWYVINDIIGKPKRNPVKSFKKKIYSNIQQINYKKLRITEPKNMKHNCIQPSIPLFQR